MEAQKHGYGGLPWCGWHAATKASGIDLIIGGFGLFQDFIIEEQILERSTLGESHILCVYDDAHIIYIWITDKLEGVTSKFHHINREADGRYKEKEYSMAIIQNEEEAMGLYASQPDSPCLQPTWLRSQFSFTSSVMIRQQLELCI